MALEGSFLAVRDALCYNGIECLSGKHGPAEVCRLSKSAAKRIVVTVPHDLLAEVDGLVQHERLSRSALIREAMWQYVREKRKALLRSRMQEGYQEMARINLHMATEAKPAEDEADLTVLRMVSGV
ncbi:MAG: ribbon-helix-helix protein, CopG family [Hydrogenibacillus sp.]|nr:ribbon-helix-helix protein, CopG family [Hydrogenibacillus sp.]